MRDQTIRRIEGGSGKRFYSPILCLFVSVLLIAVLFIGRGDIQQRENRPANRLAPRHFYPEIDMSLQLPAGWYLWTAPDSGVSSGLPIHRVLYAANERNTAAIYIHFWKHPWNLSYDQIRTIDSAYCAGHRTRPGESLRDDMLGSGLDRSGEIEDITIFEDGTMAAGNTWWKWHSFKCMQDCREFEFYATADSFEVYADLFREVERSISFPGVITGPGGRKIIRHDFPGGAVIYRERRGIGDVAAD